MTANVILILLVSAAILLIIMAVNLLHKPTPKNMEVSRYADEDKRTRDMNPGVLYAAIEGPRLDRQADFLARRATKTQRAGDITKIELEMVTVENQLDRERQLHPYRIDTERAVLINTRAAADMATEFGIPLEHWPAMLTEILKFQILLATEIGKAEVQLYTAEEDARIAIDLEGHRIAVDYRKAKALLETMSRKLGDLKKLPSLGFTPSIEKENRELLMRSLQLDKEQFDGLGKVSTPKFKE